MRWCTVYSNCTNSATFVDYVKALLKAFSRGSIFAIDWAETNPRWDLDFFFIEQLDTSLPIISQIMKNLITRQNLMPKAIKILEIELQVKLLAISATRMELVESGSAYNDSSFQNYFVGKCKKSTCASSLFGMVSKASKSGPASTRTCSLRRWKSFNFSRVTLGP